MKKYLKISGMAVATAMMMFMVSCSEDSNEPWYPSDADTRAIEVGDYIVINFEDINSEYLAGTTSYGENLYNGGYVDWEDMLDRENSFHMGLNYMNGGNYFYNGGIAISNWNIMANPDVYPQHPEQTIPTDWWYSYENQCSVYNTANGDGYNQNAGYGGSQNFGVMYGYSDAFNAQWMSNPEFHFNDGKTFTVKKMYICNSSYSYGVMVYGNKFGKYGEAVSLEEAGGWFKILAYGYDADGNPTNNGKPVEKIICDYSVTPSIALKTTWDEWDNLSDLGPVNKIKFNFQGSDSGDWGLNTPAYICIDDIYIY